MFFSNGFLQLSSLVTLITSLFEFKPDNVQWLWNSFDKSEHYWSDDQWLVSSICKSDLLKLIVQWLWVSSDDESELHSKWPSSVTLKVFSFISLNLFSLIIDNTKLIYVPKYWDLKIIISKSWEQISQQLALDHE